MIAGPFDQYPYVFFNLLLAILVALQGPLIVMSQNRQTIKDRATAETDFQVNLKNEVNIETILRELASSAPRPTSASTSSSARRAPIGCAPRCPQKCPVDPCR